MDLDDESFEGVPGGVVGGIAGGLEPLAPPPPPPEPRKPIRVGGVIKEPALVHRVEPVYPGVAISAHIPGKAPAVSTTTAATSVVASMSVRLALA